MKVKRYNLEVDPMLQHILQKRLHPHIQQHVLAQSYGQISWLHVTFTNILIRWFLHTAMTSSLSGGLPG